MVDNYSDGNKISDKAVYCNKCMKRHDWKVGCDGIRVNVDKPIISEECSCHPSERFSPCPRKYAYQECLKAALGATNFVFGGDIKSTLGSLSRYSYQVSGETVQTPQNKTDTVIAETLLAMTSIPMDEGSKKFWSSPDNIKQNVFAKEIWNAAIERVANMSLASRSNPEEVRMLKL